MKYKTFESVELHSNLFETYKRIMSITGDLCSKTKEYDLIRVGSGGGSYKIWGSGIKSNLCGFGQNFQRVYDLLSRFKSSSEFLTYLKSMSEEEADIRKSSQWKSYTSGKDNVKDSKRTKVLSRVSFIMNQSNFLSNVASKIDNLDLIKLEKLDNFFLNIHDDLNIDYRIVYFEYPITVPTGNNMKNLSNVNILYSRPDETLPNEYKKAHREFEKRFKDIFIGGDILPMLDLNLRKRCSIFRFNFESFDNL